MEDSSHPHFGTLAVHVTVGVSVGLCDALFNSNWRTRQRLQFSGRICLELDTHIWSGLGAGGYCDNAVGAVSSTGHGESITKVCLAHRIIMQMRGLSWRCSCPDLNQRPFGTVSFVAHSTFVGAHSISSLKFAAFRFSGLHSKDQKRV